MLILGQSENAGITIDLVPHVWNIMIPPYGGSFNFDIVINNPYEDMTIDLWTTVTLPNGYEFPILNINGIFFPSQTLRTYAGLTQTVPANAPAGRYIYNGYLKDPITWEVLSHDTFGFIKSRGIDFDGDVSGWLLTGWDEIDVGLPAQPTEFHFAVYPNPFNPMTNFSFELPVSGHISMVVYNVNGQIVEVMVDGFLNAGYYTRSFDGSHLPSGVYFAKFKTASMTRVEKMLLVK